MRTGRFGLGEPRAVPVGGSADATDPLGFIVLTAERLRCGALAAFFVGMGGLIAVGGAVNAVRGVSTDRSSFYGALGFTALMAGFELWLARSARRRIEAGLGPSVALPYVATVLEVAAVVGATAGRPTPTVGFEGSLIVLVLLLAFSVVRMRLPVTAFTGVAVAVGYVGLGLVTYGPGEPRRLWVAFVVAAGGVGLGLMARAFRQGATRLVAEREARERLQADLLASVEATQVGIGRELHDSVGSHLTGLSMVARGLVRRIERGAPVERAEAVDVADMVDEALRQVRRLSRGLTPSEMEPGGLPSALADLADSAVRMSEADVSFRAEGDPSALPSDVEGHLYRFAQEAVANALKHGQPSRITVALESEGGHVSLTVEDDGVGIDATAAAGGVGLRTMRHRADLVGGEFDVGPIETGGTRLRLTVPLRGSVRT